MLKIIPYNKELLASFVYDGVERKLSGIQIQPMVEFYNTLKGECYIGVIDNEVLGIAGIYPLWNGAGSAWLFLNKKAQNHKKSVFKALLEYMNMLIKKYEIRTLMVECIDDRLETHRLVQHLGFTKNREVKTTMYVKNKDELAGLEKKC